MSTDTHTHAIDARFVGSCMQKLSGSWNRKAIHCPNKSGSNVGFFSPCEGVLHAPTDRLLLICSLCSLQYANTSRKTQLLTKEHVLSDHPFQYNGWPLATRETLRLRSIVQAQPSSWNCTKDCLFNLITQLQKLFLIRLRQVRLHTDHVIGSYNLEKKMPSSPQKVSINFSIF